MSITKTNAVTLVNSAVYICDRCGNWFSFTLWGKDKNGEPEITDIHPEYCPVCGDMPLRHHDIPPPSKKVDDMVRCLLATADYLERYHESPIAARDLLSIAEYIKKSAQPHEALK